MGVYLPARCTAEALDIHTGVSVFRFVCGSNTICTVRSLGCCSSGVRCEDRKKREWGVGRLAK